MRLSNKQIKQIKKDYPKKSVEQLSQELNLKPGLVYKALGLRAEMWAFWLENLTGYLVCILLLIAPFVFVRDLSSFADLPQRVFIQAVTVFLLLLWVLRAVIKSEIRVLKSPIYTVAAGFVLWSFATMFWALNRYEAFYSAVHWAACMAVFFTVSSILYKDKWIKFIPAAIFAAASGVVLLGLAQQFFKFDWVPVISPPAAAFANPNMASHYVTIVLPIVLAMGFYKRKSFPRYIAWMVAILSVLFIFYTKTRASWVAVACALIWMVLLLAKKRLGTVFMLKVSAVFFIALTAFIVSGVMTGRVNWVIKNVGGSARYRLILWENSFEMFKEKPFHGFGAGNFKVLYSGYTHKAAIDRTFDMSTQTERVHNDYLQTAVELGIIGLLLFIAMPLYGLFLTWRLIDRNNAASYKLLVIGTSAGIVSFMATACFSFPMQRSIPLLMVFVYIGILTILYNRGHEDKNIVKLQVPKALAVFTFLVLLFCVVALIRFNWRNIICDKYYMEALRMEKAMANTRVITAGHSAHKYNRYRNDVLLTLGRAYVATGNFPKGIEVLEKVIDKYPCLNAFFFLAVAYGNLGNYEKAHEILRKVLKIKPDFHEAQKMVFLLKTHGKVWVNLK